VETVIAKPAPRAAWREHLLRRCPLWRQDHTNSLRFPNNSGLALQRQRAFGTQVLRPEFSHWPAGWRRTLVCGPSSGTPSHTGRLLCLCQVLPPPSRLLHAHDGCPACSGRASASRACRAPTWHQPAQTLDGRLHARV